VTDGLTTTWLADRDTPSARRTVALAARALAALAAPAGPDEPAPTEPDLLTPTEELDDAH